MKTFEKPGEFKKKKTKAGIDRATAIAFASLYRGGTDEQIGNATECYMALRPKASRRTANSMGSKYLNDPLVQELLEEHTRRVAAKANVTQEYVLRTIQETIERCSQAKPVTRGGEPVMVETPDGELAPAFTFDATNVLKGSELLGKHLKMWTDKVDLAGDINHRYAISDEPEQSSDEWLSNHKPT